MPPKLKIRRKSKGLPKVEKIRNYEAREAVEGYAEAEKRRALKIKKRRKNIKTVATDLVGMGVGALIGSKTKGVDELKGFRSAQGALLGHATVNLGSDMIANRRKKKKKNSTTKDK